MTPSLSSESSVKENSLVYQVFSSSRQAEYSLKIFPKSEFGTKQYKKEMIISQLTHPNIIQYIPAKCLSSKFYGLTTEIAKYGDFFDLVTSGYLRTETLVRTYFHQLIEGLEYMHSQGFAHLDLKLENLMLGSGKNLKIIDFDQAQPITDQHMSSAGSIGYRAPEVINGACSNLAAADIYSAGVILYTFIAREFPYAEMEEQDATDIRCYSAMASNSEVFWKTKALLKGNTKLFSKNFIELVNGMVRYEPSKRLSLKAIKKSKWYNGPILDSKSLRVEMKTK